MKGCILSPEARNDLHEIWEFIAVDSIDAADRVISEIEEACNKLSEMPGLGHQRSDLTDKPLRFWTVRSYLVVYRPERKPLEIVRILSGYRDVTLLLQ